MTGPFTNLPYRRCAGILLLNGEGKVLVATRIDQQEEAWQMPQGGIDEGETPREAALRELKEELGTDKAEIIAESQSWLTYDLPADVVPKVWGGRYRGQAQKWFVLRFLGKDSDIHLETAHPEFSSWKWIGMADLPGIIVPFKRDIYVRLVEEFSPLIENLAEQSSKKRTSFCSI